MPLRATIKASPETLSDLLLAADDRYLDAEDLLVNERLDGAVRSFGYATEMWLKAVCLRLQGLGPTAPVKAALPALKTWMKLNAPGVAFTDYHDLSFFAHAIIHLRTSQGRPLPPTLLQEMLARIINGLHEEWIVDMRYRRCGLSFADAFAALTNSWWAKTNWGHLV